ncbi:hypothetical protein [Salirhabdus salicampi]|uniref:hypothetical protein n=1 Tax=Salirhabdus salicampi TaxID=476102 RepID=UPI0020C1F990|nr:hypothetical protein [Salirhabdus salicampi]MCP8617942.1 hypothetical protein [Salirhabdus salicampi]
MSILMQRHPFLILFMSLFLVVGCTESSKSEGGMMNVPEEGNYHFKAFIDKDIETQYQQMRNVVSELNESTDINLTETAVLNRSEAILEKYGHLIDDFPTYILIDHSGIVVNTSDADEIVNFMKTEK